MGRSPRQTLANSAATIPGPSAQGQPCDQVGGSGYPAEVASLPHANRSRPGEIARETALGLLLGGLGGCAELGEPRFAPEVGTIEILASVPVAGASEVDPAARIDVCLSTFADPRVFDDFSATLHSGNLVFDAQIELQLLGWRAPGRRDALADTPWCPGSVVSLTPRSPLQPGLTYRVRLQPVARGWAGETLDTTTAGWGLDEQGVPIWTLEFRVAGQPGDEPPDSLPTLLTGPTLTELFDAGGPFDPARDLCSCHRDVEAVARARLDLSSPAAAWTDLVLAESIGTTGFPLVAPTQPQSSALVQELLRDAGDEPLWTAEHPMPPESPLGFAELVVISHWIADGAAL